MLSQFRAWANQLMSFGPTASMLCFAWMLPGSILAQEGPPSAPAEIKVDQPVRPRPTESKGMPEQGWDIPVPGFADTVLGDQTGLRPALARRAVGMMNYVLNTYAQNLLDPPRTPQHFSGQRPTYIGNHEAVLTWTPQSHIFAHSQFVLAGVYTGTSWSPLGPRTARFSELSFYQSLFNKKLEVEAGYIDNSVRWVGLSVAGSLVGSTLGIDAVIPFEVGLNRLPIVTPSADLRYNGPKDAYFKVGVQRSTNPLGPDAEVHSDAVGLRFHAKGDGVLTIAEIGRNRRSSVTGHGLWIRAGGIYNRTGYHDFRSGGLTPENYAGFVAADLQIAQSDRALPYRGLYAGASANLAPSVQNIYSQYYEARAYVLGPFSKRPVDIASFLISNTVFSGSAGRATRAAGVTTAHSSTSITGSYTYRLARGTYLAGALSTADRPAFSPRLGRTLTAQVQLNLLF